jgi:RNA polymerase sigma factor (sigma-70 family)
VPERGSGDENVSFRRLTGYVGNPRADTRTLTPHALLAPARLAGQPILRTQTDERLVDLVRAGYEPAFEAVVARYRRALMRYCGRILPEERAEDVVQQTFVKAYDAMKDGDAGLNLRPWLYRIAHNTALNALRDRGLRHEELSDSYDGVERPDQAMERRQGVREVLAAVQALPERQRDALVLRELEGRSYEEIAGELGVTGGAVRQLLSRARTSVRTAATAVTPVGLLIRLPLESGADSVGGRVAEATAGAGAGAVTAKLGATALATGALVGGIAAVPHRDRTDSASAEPISTLPFEGAADGRFRQLASEGHRRAEAEHPRWREEGDHRGRQAEAEDEHGSGDGTDHSGRRGGDDRSGSGDSGSGSGTSRSGSGDSGSGSGSSGSGSSGSGDSGSGSSSSGPGSGDSGSLSSSGSGSSGSGSGDSGSSGPGSGDLFLQDSSGSGSSGPG